MTILICAQFVIAWVAITAFVITIDNLTVKKHPPLEDGESMEMKDDSITESD